MKSIAPPEEELNESEQIKEKTEAGESDEEAEIDQQITELQVEELREQKRKRKKVLKERKKLNEKLNLKMVLKGDDGPKLEGDDMFNLKQIVSEKQLEKMTDQSPDILAESDNDEDEKPKQKYQRYSKEDSHLDSSGLYYKDSDSELEMESGEDDDDEIGEGLGLSDSEAEDKKPGKKEKKQKEKDHPLITDLDYRNKEQKRAHKAELFFERDVFKNLIDEKDEDADLDKMVADYKKKGTKVLGEELQVESKKKKAEKQVASDSDYSSEDSESEAEDYDIEKEYTSMKKKTEGAVGPQPKKQKRKLTVEDLALGTMMVNSKKTKRDLIDGGWNRYAFNDDHLPDWFVEDENKHMKKELPVPKVSLFQLELFCFNAILFRNLLMIIRKNWRKLMLDQSKK